MPELQESDGLIYKTISKRIFGLIFGLIVGVIVDSNTNAISAKIPMQSRNKYVVATKTFQSKREIKAVEPYEKRNCSQ